MEIPVRSCGLHLLVRLGSGSGQVGCGSDPSKRAVRPTQRKEAVAENRAFIQQKAPRFVQRLLGAGCLEGMGGEMEKWGS